MQQEQNKAYIITEKLYHTIPKVFLNYAGQREFALKSLGNLAYYCSADTAYNVIKNKELWLRKTTCMNDYKEIDYGLEKLKKLFNDHSITKRLDDFFVKTNKNLTSSILYEYMMEKLKSINNNTYITCLTEHSKNENELGRLSMWRAYGRNSGVALVFNEKETAIMEMNDSHLLLRSPVLYKAPNNDLNNEFSQILDNMYREINTLQYLNEDEYKKIFLSLFAISVPSIKHSGFSEEKEWRILYTLMDGDSAADNTPIGLKKATKIINGIPQIVYILSYPKPIEQILSKVIIGPTEFPDVIYDAFYDLLKENGIYNPDDYIIKTSIPLRV